MGGWASCRTALSSGSSSKRYETIDDGDDRGDGDGAEGMGAVCLLWPNVEGQDTVGGIPTIPRYYL